MLSDMSTERFATAPVAVKSEGWKGLGASFHMSVDSNYMCQQVCT